MKKLNGSIIIFISFLIIFIGLFSLMLFPFYFEDISAKDPNCVYKDLIDYLEKNNIEYSVENPIKLYIDSVNISNEKVNIVIKYNEDNIYVDYIFPKMEYPFEYYQYYEEIKNLKNDNIVLFDGLHIK